MMMETDEKMYMTASFKNYAVMLKNNQDKNERLFKICRDIVIESKRIIFLLHTILRESNKADVLEQAEKRLKNLESVEFKKIQQELEGENPYRHARVVASANQEYIEALSFWEFLKFGDVKGFSSCSNLPLVPNTDYIMGLADLSGELMRLCVASLASDNSTEINDICNFLRILYSEFLGLCDFSKLTEKVKTMSASVMKVERIKYELHIMTAEAAKFNSTDKVKTPRQRIMESINSLGVEVS